MNEEELTKSAIFDKEMSNVEEIDLLQLPNKESEREKVVLERGGISERVKTKSAIVEGSVHLGGEEDKEFERVTRKSGIVEGNVHTGGEETTLTGSQEPPVLVKDEFVSDEEDEDEEEIESPEMIKYPSRSKALNSLPTKFRRLLKKNLLQLITEEEAKKCLSSERFQFVCDTNPLPGSLYLSDSIGYAFLFWLTKGPGDEFIVEEEIRKILKFVAGPIRDQFEHLICWAYVCCDLISATRLLHGLDKVFVRLSPMFLCRNIDTERYEKIWQNMSMVDEHCCFPNNLLNGLMYAKLHGISREKAGEEEFDCSDANEYIAGDEELFKD